MLEYLSSRYLAICHPLKSSLQLTKRGTGCVIMTVWILCLLPSISWSMYAQVLLIEFGRTYMIYLKYLH